MKFHRYSKQILSLRQDGGRKYQNASPVFSVTWYPGIPGKIPEPLGTKPTKLYNENGMKINPINEI